MPDNPTAQKKRGRPRGPRRTEVSASELMVLRGLASGRRPDEVAERLHLSRSCVSMRIQRAAKALGARTTPQLMYIASSLGLLEGVPRP